MILVSCQLLAKEHRIIHRVLTHTAKTHFSTSKALALVSGTQKRASQQLVVKLASKDNCGLRIAIIYSFDAAGEIRSFRNRALFHLKTFFIDVSFSFHWFSAGGIACDDCMPMM